MAEFASGDPAESLARQPMLEASTSDMKSMQIIFLDIMKDALIFSSP
jgi:hypothetical protein